MTELYTYQVARIRCRELSLLTKQDLDSLLGAKSYEDCIRILFDKGFGTGNEKTSEEILEVENEKLWSFMDELIKDKSVFDVLTLPTDYNNLKAAIKSVVTNTNHSKIFKDGGNVSTELLLTAVKNNEFNILPKAMAIAGEKAYKTLLQTRDGQLCDMIIDKACLENIVESGETSEDELIKNYAKIYVAIANIKTAVRCQRTKKTANFIKEALANVDGLNINALIVATSKSEDDLFTFLSHSSFDSCVDKIKESNSSFEKWCDDTLMELVKKQKHNPFTIGPLIAYVIARENEMNAVKIILSGKLNDIKDEIIRERLREMYV